MNEADNSKLPDYKSLNENARRECDRLRAEVERLKKEAKLEIDQLLHEREDWKARAQSAEAALAELREAMQGGPAFERAYRKLVLGELVGGSDGATYVFRVPTTDDFRAALRSLLPTSTDKGGEDAGT